MKVPQRHPHREHNDPDFKEVQPQVIADPVCPVTRRRRSPYDEQDGSRQQ